MWYNFLAFSRLMQTQPEHTRAHQKEMREKKKERSEEAEKRGEKGEAINCMNSTKVPAALTVVLYQELFGIV